MGIASSEIGVAEGADGLDGSDGSAYAYIQIGKGEKEKQEQHGDRGLGGETGMHDKCKM